MSAEPSTAPILIVTGPPGIGKTTASKILARRSGRAVHLESDSFFRFIQAGYVEPWRRESHAQNQVVMRIVAQASAGYAAAGYFTIIDGIVIPDWFLDPLRSALHDAGLEVAYAVLRAPLATCLARARNREREPLSDPSVIERLWLSFSDLGALEERAIDLTNESPEAVAEALAHRLADGSLAI